MRKKYILLALPLIVVSAVVFYYKFIYKKEVIVVSDNEASIGSGYSIVRISSNIDLVELKKNSADFYCSVYSTAGAADTEGCVLFSENEFAEKNIRWKTPMPPAVPNIFYAIVRYKKESGTKVGIELGFVPHVISNPIYIKIDG